MMQNILHYLLQINLSYLFQGIYLFTIFFVVGLVIHEKRDPVKTISWVLVIILLPIVGVIFYFVFGQNYRKQKMFSRKGLKDIAFIDKIQEEQLLSFSKNKLGKHVRSDFRSIIGLLLNNSKSLYTENNSVKILNNGGETFDHIVDAISKAEVYIHLEYYIFSDDKIGTRIQQLLIEKAAKGVEVCLIYDDVGSWYLKSTFVQEMRQAGIQVYPFMEVSFPWFTRKVNFRNHRKIVVVDGKVGFVGGVNVADRYIEGDPKLGFWRDTHLEMVGDAVRLLALVFQMDWYFVSGKTFEPLDRYLPPFGKVGDTAVQICSAGPDSDWASIMQAYFSAITKAKKHIYISTPYFMPNESILTAIKTAALSGVDVRIMIPHKSDSAIVYWSTLSYLAEMLEAGVKFYFYEKGFNHSKIMMVDGSFASVGTANLDIRSFEDNFEVSAFIYDDAVTQELERQFHADLLNCRLITLHYWERRPFINSLKEGVARLFSPLL
ncbi:cardiolipin synthase [Alistipes sp. ZOR0009]|uniref:cardiolipin synthase n=1 Tax=Alistipes sp. ZOR0009 TaxID=1339253 RepID=UPI00068959AD|nr:cardiolipin synthase [Alistipes sp. ZOR0009]